MLAPFALTSSFVSLRSDFHFALRQLRKSPGFAAAAVLTLALGIGATTAVYSLVDGVLLRPLPLPHPEQLVAVHTRVQQPGGGPWDDQSSYPDYLDWAARNHTFSGIAAVDISDRLINLPNGVAGAVLPMNFVTANYFDVLGVQPIAGATLLRMRMSLAGAWRLSDMTIGSGSLGLIRRRLVRRFM